MKLKKIVKVLLSCVLAGALFTGCGGSSGDTGSKPADEPTPVKLGMITHLNANEKKMEQILDNVTEKTGVNVSKYVITFYDSLKLMQMGIESGSVEQISVYTCVGNYITALNDKYEVVKDTSLMKLSDSFCFAVRKDDTQLKADLDKVIIDMKTDGTLDKLVAEYITNVKPDDIPTVEIPMIDGAETIKVGVTGDLPPLDLILADGSPAGFNTAMLAEIGKRLNRN
ncbi:MAG: transporter substrate-binding domain-containing protein, partial [Quinella sp. 1Q7]|nr:transporter substrate-binding domain-containing protein [Quinella sp. 1Q7]